MISLPSSRIEILLSAFHFLFISFQLLRRWNRQRSLGLLFSQLHVTQITKLILSYPYPYPYPYPILILSYPILSLSCPYPILILASSILF